MDVMLSATVLVLFVYVVASMTGLNQRVARQGMRLARLERTLDAIAKHLAVSIPDEVDPKVLELAIAGKKIEAIKAYRELTGVSLKEAKEYVESL
jgi:ribosomal protein L7/L12